MIKTPCVEVHLVGGYFSTAFLRDKEGRKLYTEVEQARKAGIKDPESSPLVVRWNNGTPVGKIEMSEKKKRVWRIPKNETAIIEALTYHELVDSELKKCSAPKLIIKDTAKAQELRTEKIQKRGMVDTIFVNLETAQINDLAAVLGYPLDDAYDRLFTLKDSDPDKFLSYFKEPFKKGKFWTAELKEETVVSAVLKRAMLSAVVQTKAGSVSFEDEMIGTDFDTAVRNMMDNTKGGKSAILTLIKAKMK